MDPRTKTALTVIAVGAVAGGIAGFVVRAVALQSGVQPAYAAAAGVMVGAGAQFFAVRSVL